MRIKRSFLPLGHSYNEFIVSGSTNLLRVRGERKMSSAIPSLLLKKFWKIRIVIEEQNKTRDWWADTHAMNGTIKAHADRPWRFLLLK